MSDRYFEDERAVPVIDALKTWLSTHPTPDQPFFIIMSEFRGRRFGEGPPRREKSSSALTPRDFVREVESGSQTGAQFLQFVLKQADLYEVEPQDFVWRAVEANRRPDLSPERA